MERQQLQDTVDKLYEDSDREVFEVMSRILDEVRDFSNYERVLGRVALIEPNIIHPAA